MIAMTDAELVAMRAVAESSMTETAQILRFTEIGDGAGGSVIAWASVATVPCRVAPQLNQPQAVQFAARLGENVGWRLTLVAGTDVRTADRIRVGAREWEVLGVLAAWTYETGRVCFCVEREAVT